MARFEDTPDLFGVGVGAGTYANINCDWCRTKYSGRETADGEATSDESITWTDFGDLQICDCCFEKVENAVLERMDAIVPWFIRILAKRRERLAGREAMIIELKKALLHDVPSAEVTH